MKVRRFLGILILSLFISCDVVADTTVEEDLKILNSWLYKKYGQKIVLESCIYKVEWDDTTDYIPLNNFEIYEIKKGEQIPAQPAKTKSDSKWDPWFKPTEAQPSRYDPPYVRISHLDFNKRFVIKYKNGEKSERYDYRFYVQQDSNLKEFANKLWDMTQKTGCR